MNKIRFSKFNGQGNDFIIIDATNKTVNLTATKIVEMCDRNFGIGADGLIMIKKSNKYDLKMDYYNKDGLAAEMCGNGIRCMAAFSYNNKIIGNQDLTIETAAGKKSVYIDLEKNKIKSIKVDMGTPEFRPDKIPVNIEGESQIFDYEIMTDNKKFRINCVSMGNPHCVVFLDKNTDLGSYDVGMWGARLENLNIFPGKTNVEFVKVNNGKGLDLRVWERGVGETLACGTGACAAVICAIKSKKYMENRVAVNMPGGELYIIWNPVKTRIFLEGGVDHNFDGEYYL